MCEAASRSGLAHGSRVRVWSLFGPRSWSGLGPAARFGSLVPGLARRSGLDQALFRAVTRTDSHELADIGQATAGPYMCQQMEFTLSPEFIYLE